MTPTCSAPARRWRLTAGTCTATSSPGPGSACCRCTRRRWSTSSTIAQLTSSRARRRSTARISLGISPREELQDPARYAIPLHWIAEDGLIPTRRNGRDVKVPGVAEHLSELNWEHGWLCGWCDVTASTNERTAIPAFLPRVAVGNKFPLMFPLRLPCPGSGPHRHAEFAGLRLRQPTEDRRHRYEACSSGSSCPSPPPRRWNRTRASSPPVSSNSSTPPTT